MEFPGRTVPGDGDDGLKVSTLARMRLEPTAEECATVLRTMRGPRKSIFLMVEVDMGATKMRRDFSMATFSTHVYAGLRSYEVVGFDAIGRREWCRRRMAGLS